MKILWVLVTILIGSTAMAQTPAQLLDPTNEALVGTQTVQVFDGKPAVLIEPFAATPTPPPNPADLLPAPTLAIPPLKMQTPFGHNGTAAYVDHVTDRIVWVQILDPETVRVTDQVQMVQTDSTRPWTGTFHQGATDIEVQSLTHNGRKADFNLIQTPRELTIQTKDSLGKGLQNIVSDYIVRGALTSDTSTTELNLSLAKSDTPRLTERMTVVVLMPAKTSFYVTELLFGSNGATVPDQYRVHSDVKGNLIFQMQHPLPARTSVGLHLIFDGAVFGKADSALPVDILVGLVFGAVWLFYVLLSVGECRLGKYRRPLATARRVSPVLAAAFLGGLPADSTAQWPKDIRGSGFTRHPILLTGLAFFRFCGEYVIGLALLNLGVRLTAAYWNFRLSAGLITFVGMLSLLGLFLIYLFGARFRVRYLCSRIREALLTTPEGITPALHHIPVYDAWALILGCRGEWHHLLTTNNPSLQKRFTGAKGKQ